MFWRRGRSVPCMVARWVASPSTVTACDASRYPDSNAAEYVSANGGADAVTIGAPQAGTYYIGVLTYSVFSGWTLSATY
ncbi:MAG: hypothetical protein DI536_15845 [Archangium gephyra]|uniref:Peptidase C-terminal archaeal/bacterial domain-containing protein n=1 Tax=Archangium gephyra TaxID=48 RepID=A0A2W5T8G9_9BACT|nr:MAG: hypothetical protein DI536_15845 [Archangium gephyra]